MRSEIRYPCHPSGPTRRTNGDTRISVVTVHQLASSFAPRFFAAAPIIAVGTAAIIPSNTTANARYPRLAHPKTVFGVKYKQISVAGAIEGRIKCLMILCPDINGVPRSIETLSAVCPHEFMPYISVIRPLCFNAVFIHCRDLPNAQAKLRGLMLSLRAAVSSSLWCGCEIIKVKVQDVCRHQRPS